MLQFFFTLLFAIPIMTGLPFSPRLWKAACGTLTWGILRPGFQSSLTAANQLWPWRQSIHPPGFSLSGYKKEVDSRVPSRADSSSPFLTLALIFLYSIIPETLASSCISSSYMRRWQAAQQWKGKESLLKKQTKKILKRISSQEFPILWCVGDCS